MLTKEQLLKASEDQFMNDEQLAFMRQKLLDMRQQIIGDGRTSVLEVETERLSEVADQAQQEEQWMIAIRTRSLESDLLSNIEKALYKVEISMATVNTVAIPLTSAGF